MDEPMVSRATKRCPYCAEEVLAEAVKCKYCGEWLDRRKAAATLAPYAGTRIYSNAQPLWHLFVLALLTSGLYQIYWVYRNWRDLRRDEGVPVSPGWRTLGLVIPLLNLVLVYKQFRLIGVLARGSGVRAYRSPAALALGVVIFNGAAFVLSIHALRFNQPVVTRPWTFLGFELLSLFLDMIAVALLAIVQRTLNRYWAERTPDLKIRTGFSTWEVIAMVLGGLITVLGLVEPFTPDRSKVL